MQRSGVRLPSAPLKKPCSQTLRTRLFRLKSWGVSCSSQHQVKGARSGFVVVTFVVGADLRLAVGLMCPPVGGVYQLGFAIHRHSNWASAVPDIDQFIQKHVVKEAQTSSRIEGTQTDIAEALMSEQQIQRKCAN